MILYNHKNNKILHILKTELRKNLNVMEFFIIVCFRELCFKPHKNQKDEKVHFSRNSCNSHILYVGSNFKK